MALSIWELYAYGGNSGADFTNDFITLHNTSAVSFYLSGMSIQYASATGATWTVVPLPAAYIPAGGYYLVQLAFGGSNGGALPSPDYSSNAVNLSAVAGKIALVDSTVALSGAAPAGGGVIDLIGYGATASWYEGSGPAMEPSIYKVLRYNDTNQNSSDFLGVYPPTPHNSGSTHDGAPLVHSDPSGDRASDILFRNADGVAYLWTMSDATVESGALLSTQVGTNWQIKAIGDFDGDGASDLLWEYTNMGNDADAMNGLSYVTLQQGATATEQSGVVQQLDSAWTLVGAGDLWGFNSTNLLYRHAKTGQTYVTQLIGARVYNYGSGFTSQTVEDPNWRVAAIADFDGDRRADVLWRYMNDSNASDPLNGTLYEWKMNGTTVASGHLLSQQAGANWNVVGTGDFDGDDRADILFRYNNAADAGDPLNGMTYIDFMNGATVLGSSAPTQWQVDNVWAVRSIGDYSGDGRADILWENTDKARMFIWDMNGAAVTSGAYTSTQAGFGWSVQNGVLISG